MSSLSSAGIVKSNRRESNGCLLPQAGRGETLLSPENFPTGIEARDIVKRALVGSAYRAPRECNVSNSKAGFLKEPGLLVFRLAFAKKRWKTWRE